jgi:hypothetical protein
MTFTFQTQLATNEQCDPARRVVGNLRLDLTASMLAFWIIAGLFMDGFAHHNLPEPPESFFTPWHAVLYSGFAALAGFLIYQLVSNMRQGYAWRQAIPSGYSLSMIGIPIFGMTGIADMIWHQTFGFEVGVENLFSPTHMMLAVSGVLLISGPLLATWRRSDGETKPGWKTHFPAALALLMILSTLTFFTEYANTFSSPELVVRPEFLILPRGLGISRHDALFEYHRQIQGVLGIFMPMIITLGIILLGVRQRSLPVGSMTLLIGGNSLLMAVFHFKEISAYPQVLVAGLAGGLIADFIFWWLKPSTERTSALRIFAFVVPMLLTLLLLLILMGTVGIWWTLPIWTGVVFLSGVIGLLLSCIVVPPAKFD